MCDIAWVSACVNLLNLLFLEEDRAQFKSVTRWFNIINQPAFQSVVGKVDEKAPAGGAMVANVRKQTPK